jgi:hypothetical protein
MVKVAPTGRRVIWISRHIHRELTASSAWIGVVTSDAGLLAYRELDDALGLTVMAGEMLAGARTGKTGRHALVGLLVRWLRRLRWYWNGVSIVLKV